MHPVRQQLWPWLSGALLATGLCLTPAWAAPTDPFPQAAAAYLLLVQGEPQWARHADIPLPPASLTKIMTALLAVESHKLEETATVGAAAAGETGSRIGLKPGDQLKAGDLLAATLLMSANDACHALADHVAGSEAQFISLMNRRAATLGLRHTHFTNACGHDQPGHVSTARELATLAQAAMDDPAFASLAGVVRTTIATTDGARRFQLDNKNELIGRYPGAVGVKSGFTAKAGKCIAAAVNRDGRRVLLVLLNAPDRWWTAVSMLDHAFGSTQVSRAGTPAP
ncbi:MAG: D-alanyl-D-alanine carboxypeptidase [Nitrospirae bacterium]|nr:MAG: D-alanyl-D-alanine carboxypeptidase [Nitrospirota bacterium]